MQAARGESRTLIGILALLVVIVALFSLLAVTVYLATTLLPPLTPEQQPIANAVLTAAGLIFGLVSVWVMGRVIERASRPVLGEGRARTVRRVLTYFLYAAVFVSALSQFKDISGYLLSIGIVAVIIGLAAQTVIGNLLAGVIVLVGRPFRVGDYIRLIVAPTPVEGRVIDIDFLKCRVETNDRIVVSIPNSLLLNNSVANYTVRENRPLRIAVGLARLEDEEKFRELATSKLSSMLEGKPAIRIYVTGYETESFNLEVWVTARTSQFLRERSAIIDALRKLCDKSKIPLKRVSIVT